MAEVYKDGVKQPHTKNPNALSRRRFRQKASTNNDSQAEIALAKQPVEPVDDGYGYSIDPKILACLSPEQLRYVVWEVTPDFFKPPDCRTLEAIGAELGVMRTTLYRWRGLPHVVRAFAAFSMYVIRSGIADKQVFENLVNLTATDTKAQEVYWKLRGVLTDHAPPAQVNNLNIDARQIRVDSQKLLEGFHERLEAAVS